MYRILIVEDDEIIASEVAKSLNSWGFDAMIAQDFVRVDEEFTRLDPQLVIMDISLPYYNGYYWCERIRRGSKAPIVFLSSRSDTADVVMAVNMGGDDYIAKPVDPELLIAKVQALLRRTYEFGAAAPVLEHAGAILNTGDNTLTYADEHIALTKNEYRILLTLMQNKGKIVSREKLMEALWQTDSFVDENTLTVNVGRLRKKLENAGLHDFITTKFGVGYAVGEK